jgi:hypothetical protein
MKKIIASIGLVALGAVNSQAQYAPGLTPQETTKPWALSADLRGFYDDNYLTLPKYIPNPTPPGPGVPPFVKGARDTWGIEVSPSAAFNYSKEQTLLSASYVYDLRWYEDRSTTDQSHQFNTQLKHTFSERYKMQVTDSFVIAQQPTVIDPSVVSSPLRTAGSNIRNTGALDFTAELSPLFDLHAGYANTLYAYQQTEGDVVVYPGQLRNPSRSALLDRIEQLATLDLRWKVQPETTGVFGYQYEHVDYTSPEGIIFTPNAGDPTGSSPSSATAFAHVRNTDSHFVFVGADESFTSQINGSIRVGGEYVDYYNAHTDRLSPYVDASLTYQYMEGSYVQVGAKNVHNATDVVGYGLATGGKSPVLDAQSTAVYFSLQQQIASRVTGSVLGQYQNSRFNGGDEAGLSDDFFILGVNFAYHFNPFVLVEAGYNWNKLNSDIPYRGYTRNMVYLGVRGSY